MYETFFRFRHRPFLASPTMERYFPGQAIEHARQALLRCIERAQGAGVVIGPAGAGKSLLCQILADQLSGSYRVALLANARLNTRKSFLQSVLFELGLPFRGLDEGEMRLSLIQHLEPSTECPNGLVLIVDEAHTLPLRIMEELRSLTNIVRQGRARVQVVLAGGPVLEEHFAHPKLESFHQRIAARCYLSAFQRSETSDYVLAQLAWVDAPNREIFPAESLEAVYRATDGIPRLINQVCDLALSMAAEQGRSLIEPRQIEEAWAELQQLPAPWHNPTPTGNAGGASIVEFGTLDDEPYASAASAQFDAPTSADVVARTDETSASLEACFDAAPAVEPKTVELPTHLFGDGFTEQETVVDRFAPSIESSIASRLRVQCDEGKQLGQLLLGVNEPHSTTIFESSAVESPAVESAVESSPLNSPVAPVAEATAEEALLTAIRSLPPVDDPRRWTPGALSPHVGASWEFSGSNDLPIMAPPVVDAPVVEEPVRTHSLRRPHLMGLPHDDRDLLIVEEEEAVAEAPSNPEQGRAQRQEYRRLFSRLRRG